MNPYNFALLFFAFCTFFLSLLIWLKRRDQIGRHYFIFSIFVTIWGIGEAIQFSQSSSYEVSLLAGRICNIAAVFIPVTWLHFTSVFSDRVARARRFLIFLYCLSCVISLFGFSPWFIPRVEPALSFNHFVRPGPIYHVFTLMFFTIVPFGFFQLIDKMRKSETEEATQLKGFIIATAAGFIGGSLTFLPVYEIMIPQYGLFLIPIYPLVTAYFMIRHRLFDIEQAIQAFQREKLATIGLLAASVNHEIRNPLYAVKGLLENYIDDDEMGRQRKTPLEVSKRALSQVNRALDVITKLNRFAKPAIETNPQTQTASIPEALQNVLDLVSYEFELGKIHIKNNLPKDLPLIQADQRQLEEILFNLIVNACHAMKKGGTLVIASERSERSNLETKGLLRRPFGTPRNDDAVQITIQDTGTGIAPEQAKHLFEPFHTTKGENGTGLGLYITKQLVERNNGRISVQSQNGKGAVFLIDFLKAEAKT